MVHHRQFRGRDRIGGVFYEVTSCHMLLFMVQTTFRMLYTGTHCDYIETEVEY